MNTCFDQLAHLYTTMDHAWNKTAAGYGFHCHGCRDNCCFSLFYHHTHLEKAYMIHGFRHLPQPEQEEIRLKAAQYCQTTFDSTGPDLTTSKKHPCPLLLDGRCRLYEFRPMICRMHGLPHELHKPGFQTFKGPGCAAGEFDDQEYIPFDRTPFYREMAKIEMEFRVHTGANTRIKQVIAQMILDADPYQS